MRFFQRVPIIVWVMLVTTVLVGAGVWFFSKNSDITKSEDSTKPIAVSKPVEGTVDYTIVGRNHIASGTQGTGYNSDPPSSGPHWPSPAKNGVYDSELPDLELVHNLEHGYVWISYEGNAGDDVKNKLKDIVKSDDWKIVMEPREKNQSKIALVAWGRVLKMDDIDYDKVKAFIKTYRNRGPEKTPD